MATLDDLKDIFSSVNNSIILQSSNLNLQMSMFKESNETLLEIAKNQKEILEDILRLSKRNDKREDDKLKPKPDTSVLPDTVPVTPVQSASSKYGEELGSGLAEIPNSLLAAGAALALAFAGLRGWEGKIIGYVKDGLGSITDSIMNGLKSIKTNIFFAFGLDEAGKILPNSALDDLLKKPIIQTLTNGLSKLLYPFTMMGDFLTGIFSGSGGDAATTKVIKFLGEIGDDIGAFAKTVGNILKPIGFLFSAYDGVMAFMNTEGDILDKFVAGIGGFLGDFVGAPLDLLKNIVSWGISKLGFENAAEFLDSFSVETLINDIINGVWNTLKGVVEWVGTMFTDPATALTNLWNTTVGEGGLIDMLFTPISMAIDWITKKFGWRDEDAPPFDIYGIVSGWVTSLVSWTTDKLTSLSNTLSEGFDTVANYISTIPERIKFAAEDMFIDVASRLEKGFISFGDWIASIPARIKLLALSAINSALSGLPEWAQIVSADDVKAAQTAVNERSDSSKQKLEELDNRTQEKKADLFIRKAASGLYDSAVNATAESPITSGELETIRMKIEALRIRDAQAQLELLRNTDRDRQAQSNIVANSGNTVTTVQQGGTTNTTIFTGKNKDDLDYGLRWTN